MKSPLIVPAICLVCFTAACSGDSDDSKESAATTPTVVAQSTRTPSPGAAATSVPEPRVKLGPENATEVKLQNQASLANLEGLTWSADSTQLLVYNRQSIAAIENKQTGQLKQLASVTAPEQILDVAAGGTGSFVSRVDDTHFNLRRIDSGSVIKSVQTEGPLANVVLSRDGRMAAVQREDKIAADLYQLPEGTMVKQLTGFETAAPVYSIRFSADGKYLVWHARAQVQFQDITSAAFGPKLEHEDFVSGIALRPAGNAIATGVGKNVVIWEPGSGSAQQTLAQDGIVSAVSFSPDSNLMAVASDAGLTLWDARDAATYAKITTLPGALRSIDFAPDGTSLAVVGPDGQASIWTRQTPTK